MEYVPFAVRKLWLYCTPSDQPFSTVFSFLRMIFHFPRARMEPPRYWSNEMNGKEK